MLVPGSRAFTLLLGSLTGLTALSVDMSLPALPRLTAVFGATPDEAQLTLSIFLIGFAIGQLVYGPVSDRFGRRPVLLAGLALYGLGGLACALSPSIQLLVLGRFIQGVGGCVGRVMGPAVVRDVFSGSAAVRMLSQITQVVALAPLLAPVIGGALLGIADWWAIFLLLALCGVGLFAATARSFAESSRFRDASATRLPMLLRNYGRFLTHRICLAHLLIACCAFSGLFCYISGSSFVFIEVFGVSSQVYGILFGSTAAAFMVSAALNARLVHRHAPATLIRVGLVLLLAGGLGMPAAVLVAPGIVSVMVPMMMYVFGMGFVMPNATATAMEPMPQIAGLASSLLGSTQMAVGSLAGYLVNRLYNHTPLPMALGIGLSAASAVLVYLLLVRRRPA